MAKIQRQLPPKHILVPDTEVLWHEHKDIPVSPDFTDFWAEYGDKYEIELAVPAVVFGELIYQHTTSALKALDRANHQFGRLSAIADSSYKHNVGEAKVRRDVEKKLRSWASSIGATIHETPINSIDWSELIESALWRRAPFLEDKNVEKGFRDALILETVCDIATGSPEPNVIFISGDGRLTEACNTKRSSGSQFATYESLDGFSSFLRLLDEELTSEFVTSIQNRARKKFHFDGDDSSLLYRDDLVTQIYDTYPDEFSTPENTPSVGGLLRAAGAISTGPNWKAVSDEGIWIVTPSFRELNGTHDFVWESHIVFVKLFEFTGRTTNLLAPSAGARKLRKNDFKVTWTALVDRSGRFRRMTVDNIELDSKTFASPTSDDIRRYKLDSVDSDAA